VDNQDIQDAPVDNLSNPDAAAGHSQVVGHSPDEEVGRSLDEAAAHNRAEDGHTVNKRLVEDNLPVEGSLVEDSLLVDSLLVDSLLVDSLLADALPADDPPWAVAPTLAQVEDSQGLRSQALDMGSQVAGTPCCLSLPGAEASRRTLPHSPDLIAAHLLTCS